MECYHFNCLSYYRNLYTQTIMVILEIFSSGTPAAMMRDNAFISYPSCESSRFTNKIQIYDSSQFY